MPLFAKWFAIWGRLYPRFLLEPSPAGTDLSPTLSPEIVGTTNVDRLLEAGTIKTATTIDLSGVGGTYVPVFTVPNGERWTLYALWREGTAGASSLMISDGSLSLRLSIQSASTTVLSGISIDLPPGWSIGMEATGQGGDNAKDMQVYYTVTLEQA